MAIFLVLCIANTSRAGDGENRLDEKVKYILANADHFELFSLQPVLEMGFGSDTKFDKTKGFHGHTILGSHVIKDGDARAKLVDSLDQAVANAKAIAGCFNPRHGIRAKLKDESVDLVICFECANLHVHGPGDNKEGLMVLSSPQSLFDDVLRKADIPLAKPAEKPSKK